MAAMPDAVQLTRELLKFNTINPPGAEQACAQHLGDILLRAGFTVDYAEFAPTRTSLVAKLGGRPDKRPLGFTGHIDTVPLGAAAWKADAFGASLEGGKLYGRGSSDMKSGVAAFVVAALRMAQQLKAGPGRDARDHGGRGVRMRRRGAISSSRADYWAKSARW